MAGELILKSTTRNAEATVYKNRAVIEGASEYGCAMPGGANPTTYIGVCRDSESINTKVLVAQAPSRVYVEVDGVVSIGDKLYPSGTDGKFSTIPTNATAQNYFVRAIALQAATADGDLVLADLENYEIES